MKLLILGINFAPEIISTGPYTTALAEKMAASGDKVHVVSAQPYYPAWKVFEGHPKYWWSKGRLASGVQYVRCPHYVPQKPSGARRILHHATFAMTSLPVMLWKAAIYRPDMVMVVAPGLLSAPVGWLAARLSGAKCWLHVQDFEVEAAFATGLLKEESRIGRLAKAFDRWIHRRFDKASSISGPMLKKLSDKGIRQEQIFELRNWANLAAVKPLEGPSPFREEFDLRAEHVVLYSGNLANKQGLEIIPDAARALQDRKDIHFVICGDGPFLAPLKAMSEGLSNIEFRPLQPMERLGDLLGLASVHILPQIAGVADSVLPSKLTNMLASGRPVVATADPETALALAVEGCGLVTKPADANAMAHAIATLVDDRAEAARLGANARERALEHWDSERILARFRKIAHELVGQTPAQITDTNSTAKTSREA